jgi:serine/threonine protein kinase
MRLMDRFVLADDVELIRVVELAEDDRASFEHEAGDWAVSRPLSRKGSRIVNDDLALLLERFRESATIPAAVAAFCWDTERDAEAVLEAALPSLQSFINISWLVPAESAAAAPIAPSLEIGSEIAGYRVRDCIRVLEDTQLYLAECADGADVALKLVRHPPNPHTAAQMRAEETALQQIGGAPAPRLYERGETNDFNFLAMEWCDGVSASVRADELRRAGDTARLHALCVAIAEAYAEVHRRGVLHGDVHPGNVLVDETCAVRIVDFGLAVTSEDRHAQPRGGVAAFFAPEHAADRLAQDMPRPPDHRSEQYGVAVMLYALVTGTHYLRLSHDRPALLRAIIEGQPIPFAETGVAPARDLEAALTRALSKAPQERFASMAEFAAALRQAGPVAAGSVDRRADARRREYVDAHVARIGLGAPHGDGSRGDGPHATVTFGSAGIAYALYRVAVRRGDAEVLAQADQWATKAAAEVDAPGAIYDEALEITEASVGRVSPYHAASGVHAVRAIVAAALGDVTTVREAVEHYLATVDGPADRVDLTLGRASVLVGSVLVFDALTCLKPAAQMDDLDERLRALGDTALTDIWTDLSRSGPIGPGNPLAFLGVAHGWAGVCLASLVWSESTGAALPPEMQGRLDELADQAEPIGAGLRWPIQTHARGRHHNFLNSWCNGAPGYVFLWNAAHERFGDERYAALARGAAVQTWERRDGHGSLCCGCAGRAYALLNHHRHSGDPVWLDRARELGELERRASFPAMRDSLYKGELGGVVLAAELDDPGRARMPFFEREA